VRVLEQVGGLFLGERVGVLVCHATELTELNRIKTGKNEIVSPARLGYAGGVLWKKTWQPEVVLMLASGIVLAFFSTSLAAELLRHFGVAGFVKLNGPGSVLLATLGFHGAAIVAAVVFLKLHAVGWREALGLNQARWKFHLLFAAVLLAAVVPVMIDLKFISEMALEKMGWATNDQLAVEMFLAVKSGWLRVYLAVFAVVIAPVAEEFIFRGLLFSAAKKMGWPKLGGLVVSLLFAAIHMNAPTFLPLFAFALALTWMYERTEGLLAPMLAHSTFNAANLGLLLLAEKFGLPHS
jgi:membrane protease YdiL (CAAX protease family)